MKRLLFVIGGVLLMIGCETGSVSKDLAYVDSLTKVSHPCFYNVSK